MYLILVLSLVTSQLMVSEATTYAYNGLTRSLVKAPGEIECVEEGVFCTDCKTVAECIMVGDAFIYQELYTCATGTCTNATKDCSTAPNPKCDDQILKFSHTCRQPGVFPNPFDQCKYFICTAKTGAAVAQTCPTGYGHDSLTGLCKIKLPDETCPMVIEPCQNASQRGPVPNNPHMYYICIANSVGISQPNILVCSNNQVYNATKKACSDPAVRNTGLDTSNKCVVRGLFYDPTSCFYYNDCSATGVVPVRRACASKMYFDEKQQRCIDFTCAQTGL